MILQHKPGVLASEKDRAPEYHAQTLPPGSAPESETFKPNPTSENPLESSHAELGEVDSDSLPMTAQDSIVGADSAAVHTGLGRPVQGESSAEFRHDGTTK
jgi:hypothetical protein